MRSKISAILVTALLLLSGIFVYTVTSEQTEVVKLVDLFFTPFSEKIIYPGIEGGDNGKAH